jgi:glucose/arabinose dehydrogenase
MKRIGIAAIGLLLVSPMLAAQTAKPLAPGVVQAPRGPAPPPSLVEGKSIEIWSPEKPDNKPRFSEQTRAPYRASTPFTVTTVTNQLHVPWGMDFLPDGRVLVTERLPGALRIVDQKGVISTPLTGVPAASRTASFGLLDVALDPGFARNRRIFFTFFEVGPSNPGPGMTNSNTYVAKGTLDAAANTVRDIQVIFRSLPAWPSRRLGGKTGGRIVFDPAGNLVIVIGDRDDNPQQTMPDWMSAQKLDNHLGKTIRITQDGLPAPGNPHLKTAGALPEIWTTGHRSPQGVAYEPGTGRLWQSDLGPRGGDEINILQTGKNYGWPVVVHGIDYPGTLIGDGSTHRPGMEPPVYYWDPSRNPSGIAFYDGKLFPQWRGSLFVAMLNGKFLDRLTIRNGKVVAEEPMLMEFKSRIRDVGVGPDGAVYVLTDGGTETIAANTTPSSSLLKLTPKN